MERFVGIDLGIKTKHRAVILDGAERRGRPFSVEVSRTGFEGFLQRMQEGTEGLVKVVLEPTGLAWVPLAAWLSAAGHQVFLVKPQKASDLRKFLRQHTKTDSVDAETLARLPQVDPKGVHELILPSAKQMTLRRMVRRRERRVQDQADDKRRLHALMVMANPALMSALGDAAFGQAALAFYRHYPDPGVVIRMGLTKLRQFWRRHSKGKANDDLPGRVFDACRVAADLYSDLRKAGKLPFDYAQVQEELRDTLDCIAHAERQIQRLDKRIEQAYSELDPNRTLEEIRGIGPVIAATLEALVGSVERFSSARKFVAYTGLCPRKNQSGVRDQSMPITKAGQRLLKKYLYLAADVARHWDLDFAVYYARRYGQGDQHNRIMIALARKMALRVYALLKRRETARKRSEGSNAVDSAHYLLRTPEGALVDKKQARELVLQKYTRAHANPERYKREQAHARKREGTALAKEEWPSTDATSECAAPPGTREVSRESFQSNARKRPVHPTIPTWESMEEILPRALKKMAVKKP